MSRLLTIIFSFLLLSSCKDNLERKFHSNGQLQKVGERVNGLKEGIWIEFNEKGDTTLVTPYLNDKRHGRVRFYEDGRIKMIWTYKNGVGHGEHLSFYPNGAIESRSFKENGEQPKKVTGYYSGGELKQVSENDGVIQYFRNGQIEYELDNAYEGLVTFYDSTGIKTLQITVINGQMTDTLYQAR